MYGRWFNIAIVFLWIVMMSWLVKEKVLPPLLTGPPPDQQSLAESDQQVGWLIEWDKRPIGWATSQTARADDGTVRMTTNVHFDHLPLSGMLPEWIINLPSWTDAGKTSSEFSLDSSLETDATSDLILSSEGKLKQINSSITLVSLGQKVDLVGKVDGDEVELDIAADGFSYSTTISLNPDILMSNALTPQTHLPNLHSGQTWIVGVVSPFRYPIGSIEVMYAKVVGRQPYKYEGKTIDAWLIEYNEQPNLEYGKEKRPRCRIWVHPNGMVLRQELCLLKATMVFERKPVEEIEELSKAS